MCKDEINTLLILISEPTGSVGSWGFVINTLLISPALFNMENLLVLHCGFELSVPTFNQSRIPTFVRINLKIPFLYISLSYICAVVLMIVAAKMAVALWWKGRRIEVQFVLYLRHCSKIPGFEVRARSSLKVRTTIGVHWRHLNSSWPSIIGSSSSHHQNCRRKTKLISSSSSHLSFFPRFSMPSSC